MEQRTRVRLALFVTGLSLVALTFGGRADAASVEVPAPTDAPACVRYLAPDAETGMRPVHQQVNGCRSAVGGPN